MRRANVNVSAARWVVAVVATLGLMIAASAVAQPAQPPKPAQPPSASADPGPRAVSPQAGGQGSQVQGADPRAGGGQAVAPGMARRGVGPVRQRLLAAARRQRMMSGRWDLQSWRPGALRQRMLQQAWARGIGRAAGWRVAAARQGRQVPLLAGIRLDDAQRTGVRDINQKHRASLQDLAAKLREARRTLNQARGSTPIDEAAIRKGAAAVAAAEADLLIARGRLRTELLGVLTPGQQLLVNERRQRVQERAAARRQQPQAPVTPAPKK